MHFLNILRDTLFLCLFEGGASRGHFNSLQIMAPMPIYMTSVPTSADPTLHLLSNSDTLPSSFLKSLRSTSDVGIPSVCSDYH